MVGVRFNNQKRRKRTAKSPRLCRDRREIEGRMPL